MKYHIIVYIILVLLLNSCSDNMNVIYKQDKELGVYQCFYPENECQITLSLNSKKTYIDTISSNCILSRGVQQTVVDIQDLLDYYRLQKILEQSNVIKITFLKNTTTFPFLVRYFNKLPLDAINIFNYDMKLDIKDISKKYLQELVILVKDSKLYSEELEKMNYRSCNFSLDFSYWYNDKGLQTVPKTIDKYIIEMDSVLEKENVHFQYYPHVEYLPVSVQCYKKE